MEDVELRKLLDSHQGELKTLSKSLAAGDHGDVARILAGLAGALATGNPHIALLTPFAEKALAKAFGNSADAMLRRELAAMEAEEERQQYIAHIVEPVELLISQALVQLVRVQHNVKDEVLEALGGMRDDLTEFRQDLGKELSAAVQVGELAVKEGAIGVRVSRETTKRAFIAHLKVRGPGSVGVDLA